jgi:hypothetical protein
MVCLGWSMVRDESGIAWLIIALDAFVVEFIIARL